MRKHFPLDPTSGVENAALLPWMDGVPATGTEGSYPGHAVVTDSEAELLNVLAASGLSTSTTDLTQVAQAMSIGIFLGTFLGSANALTATLPGSVPIPLLIPGMKFTGFIGLNANTAAVTLTLAGFGSAAGTQPVTRKDGQTALASGDLSASAFVTLVWDGQVFRVTALVPSDIIALVQASGIVPVIQPAGVTLYVRPDGNDATATGAANTAASAFQTIAAAAAYGASRYYLPGRALTLQLGIPGTYAAPGNIGVGGQIVVLGSPSNQNAYVIQGAGPASGGSALIAGAGGTTLTINGVAIQNTSTINSHVGAVGDASVSVLNVTYLSTVATGQPMNVANQGGSISLFQGNVVIGFAGSFISAQGGFITVAGTISVQGTPNFTTAFAVSSGSGSNISIVPGSSFSGAATGTRYLANLNGTINTSGGGANFFPGNASVTPSSGGQYV